MHERKNQKYNPADFPFSYQNPDWNFFRSSPITMLNFSNWRNKMTMEFLRKDLMSYVSSSKVN